MRDIDEELEFGFVYLFQMLVLEHFLPHFVFFFCLMYENDRYAACHNDINDPCYARIIPGRMDIDEDGFYFRFGSAVDCLDLELIFSCRKIAE